VKEGSGNGSTMLVRPNSTTRLGHAPHPARRPQLPASATARETPKSGGSPSGLPLYVGRVTRKWRGAHRRVDTGRQIQTWSHASSSSYPRQRRVRELGRRFFSAGCSSGGREESTVADYEGLEALGDDGPHAGVSSSAREATDSMRKTKTSARGEKALSSWLDLPLSIRKPFTTLIASQFLLFISVGALIPTIPIYTEWLEVSGTMRGVVISAPAGIMLLANIPSGRLADKYGRRPLMIVGMLVIAIGDLATGAARTMLYLIPARGLTGLGRAVSEAASSAFVADLTDQAPDFRGLLVGVQQMCVAAAFIVGPAIGGWMVKEWGPPSVFYGVSVGALACAIGYSFLPETLSRNATPHTSKDSDDSSPEASPTSKIQWRRVINSPEQRGIAIMTAVFYLGVVGKVSVVPVLATSSLNADAAQVGFLFSLVSALGVICTPLVRVQGLPEHRRSMYTTNSEL